jgi:hypothetical protein
VRPAKGSTIRPLFHRSPREANCTGGESRTFARTLPDEAIVPVAAPNSLTPALAVRLGHISVAIWAVLHGVTIMAMGHLAVREEYV